MEGRLHDVLEFYEKLVACIEGLEGIAPIVDAEEALFVRIEFREQLLDEGLS